MKKIKILIISLLLSLIITPLSVKALGEGETKKLYMNFKILENGSIKVYEVAQLQPSYNGRIRTLAYKNLNSSSFTVKKEDFEGSSIYDADGISDIRISDVNIDDVNSKDLSNLTLGREYILTYSDMTGRSGYYQENITSDGRYFKIFNPSSSNRAFYMEYTYDNVAVVHNDVAEVAWNILGNSYEDDIEELIVYVELPRDDKSMRVWLRGPLHGNVERVDDKTAKITYNNLDGNNAISFRMMFDKNIVSSSTKFSNVDGKENILAVEQEAADIANAQRERARIVQFLIRIITIIWYIVLVVLIYLTYKKKKEMEKCEFNMDYLRDFPAEYGPEVVEYLINKRVSDKSMSASILNLINKGILKVEEIPTNKKKKDYEFTKTDKDVFLTESENLLIELLINIIGDNNKVTLNEIKNYGRSNKNTNSFLKKYNNWKNAVERSGEKEEFYTSAPKISKLTVFVGILGCFITFINVFLETEFILGTFALIFGIVTVIVLLTFKYRSQKGVLHYKKWMALKKFMQDFGTMEEKELPEIIVWEKYLVYATVLGCADKLERDMKTRFDQMNITEDRYPDFYTYGYYNRMYVYDSLSRGITNAVHQSYTNAVSNSVASSSNSSGSGFGGGASFGGGSFGGGGGGGHF